MNKGYRSENFTQRLFVLFTIQDILQGGPRAFMILLDSSWISSVTCLIFAGSQQRMVVPCQTCIILFLVSHLSFPAASGLQLRVPLVFSFFLFIPVLHNLIVNINVTF